MPGCLKTVAWRCATIASASSYSRYSKPHAYSWLHAASPANSENRSHGHLSVKGVIIGSLWQFPADVFERCPGLSPSLSWPCRTRTTSHSVGAHGSRTTIPLTAGRAQEARPFSKSGCCGHAVLRFARLDPSGPDQDPAE